MAKKTKKATEYETTTEILVKVNKNQTEQIISLEKTVQALRIAVEEMNKTNSGLRETINKMQQTINDMQEIINDLRKQLGQNSQNSSKPPSTGGFDKPKPQSMRQASGKTPGGQKGHIGAHMEIPHEPDEYKKHFPEKCLSCPHFSECSSRNV